MDRAPNQSLRSDLESVARAYVRAADLEEASRAEGQDPGEDLAVLRADLQALLMETLRENMIPLFDRAHAAQIAYQIVFKSPAA